MSNFDLTKYLAEGRLFEEDFKNPILDKYLELKKSIDYKTVFPTDLQSFLDSLDNTEREGLKRDLAEGRLLKEEYNLPDSDSNTDKYVNNHWDSILKDILRAHTDLRNSKGGENIPERPSQLDIDIVLGRFDGAGEFMDVDPNEYNEYFDFYDMYLVTQRDEENTKDISVEDYPEGDYSGYTKRDDLPNLAEGKLFEEEEKLQMTYKGDPVNLQISKFGGTSEEPNETVLFIAVGGKGKRKSKGSKSTLERRLKLLDQKVDKILFTSNDNTTKEIKSFDKSDFKIK